MTKDKQIAKLKKQGYQAIYHPWGSDAFWEILSADEKQSIGMGDTEEEAWEQALEGKVIATYD